MVCPKEELVMPGAYSADLRERVLLACERGRLSRVKLAALFQIGESTVSRWLQAWRAEARPSRTPAARHRGWMRRRWGSFGRLWPRPTT
jgi:transposase